MTSFTDTANRAWKLTVDIPTRSRVRAETSFDLFGVLENNAAGLQELSDHERLVQVLWVMIAPQAAAVTTGPVTPEQFGAAFDGDTIESSRAALMEAITLFFPKAKQPIIRAMLAKADQVADLATTRALALLDKVSPEFLLDLTPAETAALEAGTTTLTDLLATKSNGTATSKPASSESTQTLQI